MASGGQFVVAPDTLVETIVCDRHQRILEETCPHCLAWSGFRFVFLDATARLVCAECSRIIGGGGSRRRDGDEAVFAAISALTAPVISDQSDARDRIMYVARLLWKLPCPRTGRRTPFVADVLPDLRLPLSVGRSTDRTEPLATAPIGWRIVTLMGVVSLLEFDGPWKGLVRLTRTIDQLVEWTGEHRRSSREKDVYMPGSAGSRNRRPIRSGAEYLALARSILASKEWDAAQGMELRKQRRSLTKLIDKALATSPRALSS